MFQATTIVAVRKDGRGAMAGDGQVTFGQQMIMKHGARKVRRLYNDRVVAGFAGAAADSFALFEKFEGKLESFQGNLLRSAVELAKEWRTDRVLRRLEALLIVMDEERTLMLSGTGEVIEPDEDVIAIGSGGPYALSAGLALLHHSTLSAKDIAEHAIRIAAKVCVYTNDRIVIEEV